MTAAQLSPIGLLLTAAQHQGLLRAVRRIIKHLAIATLFAVSMLGGGELPILHASQFADAHALTHQHLHHPSPGHHEHATAEATTADADHDNSLHHPGSDRGCSHVHCCAATAILIAHSAPSPVADLGLLRFERNAAVPYGQLSNPPLRPPRLLA
jgi:hypothetical protein